MNSEHGDGPLMMIKDKVPNGLIINYNVFLTEKQYNTLVTVDEASVQCAVCTVHCTVEEYPEHVSSDGHNRNMIQHPPLEKYDLSIVRKIHNRNHCGVCNELFDPEDPDDHLSTKTHENNLLFAINKVTDITYDTDGRVNEECYHFDARLINDENFREDERSGGLYEDYWREKDMDEEYEDQIDDECIPNVDENSGQFFYVNAARKPKTLPKYMEMEVNGKKLKILFSSWHMILMLKPNRFYCMVCKSNGHVSLMPAHCATDAHKYKLESFPVVEKYDFHLIRKIDDRLYHCAHCNNLQLIGDIDDHLECSHPIVRNKNITEDCLPINNMEKNARYTRNGNFVTKSGNTATKSGNTVGKPGSTVTKPGNTVTKPDNTVTKPGNTVTKPDNTVTKPGNTVTKLGNTMTKPDNTVTKPGNTVTKPGNTVTKPDNTVTKPGNTVTKPGNTVTKPGNTVTKLDNTMTKPDNTVTKPGNTMTKPGNTVKKTVLKSSHTATKPDNTATKSSNTATMPDTVKQPDNTVTKPGNTCIPSDRVDCEMMELHMFNAKFMLSTPSYNLMVYNDRYYCCVCELMVNTEHWSKHVREVSHVEHVIRAPFMNEFSINLIRSVRNYLHCAVCNVLVEYNLIYKHLKEAVHSRNLQKAMFVPNRMRVTDNEVEKPSTSKEVAKVDDNNRYSILNQTVDETENNVEVLPNKNINSRNGTTNIEEVVEMDVNTNSIKKEVETETDASADVETDQTETKLMNLEEFVLLKRKKLCYKIMVTSYNALVPVGDGTRHCALCSVVVTHDLKRHIESRHHTDNIHKYKFLENYEKNLFRQIYHTYHCALCNVTFTKRELKVHLSWPIHLEMMSSSKHKKTEINETSVKMMEIIIEYQKERLYATDIAPRKKVGVRYQFTGNLVEAPRKNKILLYNGNVLVINWHSWNSFTKSGEGLKCSLCKMFLSSKELSWHATSVEHLKELKKNFLTEYLPALMRKVSEDTLNCVICNIEVAGNTHTVTDHIKGKKHQRNSDEIVQISSRVSDYEDCDQEVVTIQ